MKRYSNDQVAHVWAQQREEEGQSNNGNLWFRGETLYSYSTPIGRFVNGVALITSETFSTTTQGKHINPAHRATGYRAFVVPFLTLAGESNGRGPRGGPTWAETHAANLESYAARITAALDAAERARTHKDTHVETALRLDAEALRYAEVFGLSYTSSASAGELRDKLAELTAARKERERKEREAAQERDALAFEEWRNGTRYAVPSSYRLDGNGSVYMRVNGDVLETSLGASVPLAHAVKAFRFVKLCRERGETWRTNGRVIRVGHFNVESIDAEGNMRAGCHYFTWARIAEAARMAGVAGDDASAEAVEVR